MAKTQVDLRSDTVTRPTAGMRAAMAAAVVGDDVFGDDPTVLALQERVAALLGQEEALLVPSGTMANQVCLRTHTEPGDEVITEASSHLYLYEGGGYAALSGLSIRCVEGDRGKLAAPAVAAAIRPQGGLSHFPRTRVVALEQTANRGGGTVYQPAEMAAVAAVALEHGLRVHLDGARLLNAAVALGVPAASMAAACDSVSICLSKGLGCPVGSLVAGSRAFIARAHRFRKMLGGGMRQAGILAAAGLYALDHHVERLADDHRRAQELASLLAPLPGLETDPGQVESNMVFVQVTAAGQDAAGAVAALEAEGVRMVAVGERTLRAVTHLDVDDAGLEAAVAACGRLFG